MPASSSPPSLSPPSSPPPASLFPARPRDRRVAGWIAAVLVAGLPLLAPAARADEAAVLQALRQGGAAVLLRHSQTTPGVGDPEGWKFGDCASQRNLDDAGRAQARRVGEWFRQRGIVPTVVRSSPWCRTQETAKLAFGRSEDWPALGNLYGNRQVEAEHTPQVRRYVAGLRPGELAVLVSHGSSISAFTGEYVAQGESVVVRAERGADGSVRPRVVGRIVVP